MTIKKLIKKLEQLPPEVLVILSSDSEGNDFNELNDICSDKNGLYFDPENREILDQTEIKDIKEYNSRVDLNKLKKCIILFPKSYEN